MRVDRASSQRISARFSLGPWVILLVVVAQVLPKLWLFASSLGRLPVDERIAEVLFLVCSRPNHRCGFVHRPRTAAPATRQGP
jgi:hypothetical protein